MSCLKVEAVQKALFYIKGTWIYVSILIEASVLAWLILEASCDVRLNRES